MGGGGGCIRQIRPGCCRSCGEGGAGLHQPSINCTHLQHIETAYAHEPFVVMEVEHDGVSTTRQHFALAASEEVWDVA